MAETPDGQLDLQDAYVLDVEGDVYARPTVRSHCRGRIGIGNRTVKPSARLHAAAAVVQLLPTHHPTEPLPCSHALPVQPTRALPCQTPPCCARPAPVQVSGELPAGPRYYQTIEVGAEFLGNVLEEKPPKYWVRRGLGGRAKAGACACARARLPVWTWSAPVCVLVCAVRIAAFRRVVPRRRHVARVARPLRSRPHLRSHLRAHLNPALSTPSRLLPGVPGVLCAGGDPGALPT